MKNKIKEIYDLGSFHSADKVVYLDKNANWSKPNDIIEVDICSETFALASKWCKKEKEIYMHDYQPKKVCEEHSNEIFRFNRDK